ncbi:hypothetical protein [Pectobacterium zantedeschiae]|uniref:Uncharacterized protein n=1 Tax=Pectobacterium zantedeschiae TaxID=2034769 RepID=A0A9X8JM32_9GAMM|nr:hypothetical protein [Pectobacterium zantedeschiae]RYC38329.1 hypothetical protein CTN06_18260 [Pectobacterium zantedeschiae]RYC44974.1 hypothetical protein CLR69_08240 [Pectobacterium zantedeschiae]
MQPCTVALSDFVYPYTEALTIIAQRKNTLGLFFLVFFVVAAASPLTRAVGGLLIAMISGNDCGIPLHLYVLHASAANISQFIFRSACRKYSIHADWQWITNDINLSSTSGSRYA